jgi:hypothetical protein
MLRALTTAIVLALAIPLFSPPAFCAPPAKAPKSIENLIDDFTSPDWDKVHVAQALLIARQAEAIPALIKLLDRDEKVVLRNTADLIYPGAKKFYGHGWMIDYDLDWISVRAGWSLEELTFQDFGFREQFIKEEELLKAAIDRKENVPLADPARTAAVRKKRRAEACSRAKAWSQKSAGSWSRFDAVLEALRSDDPERQFWTFQWMRNGSTPCDGLNMDSFNKHILPEVERLSKSSDERVRDEVRLLLKDKAGYWLKRKTPDEKETSAK